MLQPVVEEIERSAAPRWSSPTRARRPKIWYQLLLNARPDWAGHGRAAPRLARHERARLGRSRAEGGQLKAVVATSSPRPRRGLPAGRTRAADRQRQGRGAAAAARRPQRPRAGARQPRHAGADTTRWSWWKRPPRGARRWPATSNRAPRPSKPLDVLVQHLVTHGAGRRLPAPRRCTDEVRGAWMPIAHLTREDFQWALDFVVRGRRQPACLPRIPPRDAAAPTAVTACPSRGIALRHRLQVGTIVSDARCR